MKRLYQKFYLTIVAALLVVVIVAGTVWRIASSDRRDEGLGKLGVLIAAALPEAAASRSVQRRAFIDLSTKLKLEMALYDQQRSLIVASEGAGDLTPAQISGDSAAWQRGALTIRLPDRRYGVIRLPWWGRPAALSLLALLGIVALTVGLCAYPVVRGLTRRLERLQAGVETLGSGNIKTRVAVEGRDEVARLAGSFNEAAVRIETLLGAHQQLLANASHELRTPLTRLTMGIELAKDQIEPARKASLVRDLAELDDLIDEILTASRLETLSGLEKTETIDLLALLAEECVRYDDCSLHGEMINITGDRRLLRRLIRNLVENAARYGRSPIEVSLIRRDGMAVLDVIDGGPGIPETEWENVFTPFYRVEGTAIANGARSGTAGVASGSGIGLALVRQIARRHGGNAAVLSLSDRPDNDQRHRIRVTLPLA